MQWCHAPGVTTSDSRPVSRTVTVVSTASRSTTFPRLAAGPLLRRRRLSAAAAAAHQVYLDGLTLSAEEITTRFQSLQDRVAASGDLADADLPEALGLAALAVRNVSGLEPYPVQLLAAAVVAGGAIAEMQTGEGKTLATHLAAIALSLAGRPVLVATANEYLADRDAALLRPIAALLGFTVGVSRIGADVPDRLAAHRCRVVYGTATSLGFDYLYDNLAIDLREIAMGEPYAAIVDEADSVLLDEARTPLLISGHGADTGFDFERFARLAAAFTDEDVHVDLAKNAVAPTASGVARAEAFLGVERLYDEPHLVQQLLTALHARFLLRSGVDYIVVSDPEPRVVLIDAGTGRRRERSRLRSGLHEAIEAKESVPSPGAGVTRASVAVQNFFLRFPRLGGLTGTASSAAEEFEEFYRLAVFTVPTNRPSRREDLPDRFFAAGADRDAALSEEVGALLTAGRPVLVLTDSVTDAERLSVLLEPFAPRLLSARRPEIEAEVISRAGEPAALTIATAMAGRGVDILLGGHPAEPGFEHRRDAVVAAGGLAVLSAVRFPSRRVDAQLRGRAGRQGEPGSSRFLLSFEDELPRLYAPDSIAGLLTAAGELPGRLAGNVFARAQSAVEEDDRVARRATTTADLPLARHREVFYRYRQELLGLSPWERAFAIVHAGLLRRLPDPVPSVEAAHQTLGRFWPATVEFPSFETPIPAAAIAPRLTRWFMSRLQERLDLLADLSPQERAEVLIRLIGSMALDALDRSWAAHLESAAALYADSSLTARVGQKPEGIYRSMLEDSFAEVFARFEYVAVANLGGLRLDSVTRAA